MAYSKDYTTYPPEFQMALERLFVPDVPEVRFEVPGTALSAPESRANSMKWQFYGYFRALKRAAEWPTLTPSGEMAARLWRMASQVTVKSEGAEVTLQLKSDAAGIAALREALEAAPIGEYDADKALEELKETLDEQGEQAALD